MVGTWPQLHRSGGPSCPRPDKGVYTPSACGAVQGVRDWGKKKKKKTYGYLYVLLFSHKQAEPVSQKSTCFNRVSIAHRHCFSIL